MGRQKSDLERHCRFKSFQVEGHFKALQRPDVDKRCPKSDFVEVVVLSFQIYHCPMQSPRHAPVSGRMFQRILIRLRRDTDRCIVVRAPKYANYMAEARPVSMKLLARCILSSRSCSERISAVKHAERNATCACFGSRLCRLSIMSRSNFLPPSNNALCEGSVG